jgi:hypothetical protein
LAASHPGSPATSRPAPISPDIGFRVPPGDTGLLDGLAGNLDELEQLMNDHATLIHTTAECVAPSWQGEAAQAYLTLSTLVTAHFRHAADTAANAKAALRRWSPSSTSASTKACSHSQKPSTGSHEHG